MTERSQSVDPLYDPERDASSWTPPLHLALTNAREILAEKQAANIHDRDEMIRAALGLEMRLRQLLAALDAEGILPPLPQRDPGKTL